MKLIRKSARTSFSNSSTCSGFEYSFGDKDLNIALVTVDGRYPDKGHLQNEVCKEIAYIVSGEGCVGIGKTVYELHPGDAIMITPGEKFFWEGKSLTMFMPCSPAFYPQQHKKA